MESGIGNRGRKSNQRVPLPKKSQFKEDWVNYYNHVLLEVAYIYGEAMSIEIREANGRDFEAITDIYAYHVLNGTGSFEIVPPSLDEMKKRWHKVLDWGGPYLVALIEKEVVGFAYGGPHNTREAYKWCVEDSVYVSKDHQHQGVGTALEKELIKRCKDGRFTEMVSVIGDSENIGSIKLHEKLGFKHCGCFHKVGYKFGRWLDVVFMEKTLKEEEHP